MATAFNPQYVNLDRYEAAQLARTANQLSPLDVALQGLNQGVQLQQLPQTLQDQALQRQLNNALLSQKLTDLQNPNAALARELQKIAITEAVKNPQSGIIQTPAGAIGQTIATPQAIPQTAIGLEQALAANPSMPIPTAAPTLPIVPLGTGSVQTGLSQDLNVPQQAAEDKLNRQIKLLQARPRNPVITKEGYRVNPETLELEQMFLPDDPTSGLNTQRRSQSEADAKAKTDAAKDLATTKAANTKELQEDKQKFTAEENDKNRQNRITLAEKRAKIAADVPVAASAYQAERQRRVLDSVADLEKDVGYDTVGFADWFKALPTTPAREFAGRLKTLKAAIAFGELTAMREASKTGGALGQVSNLELGLLESALGNLDQAQGPTEFKEELGKIRDSIKRWQDASAKAPQGTVNSASPAAAPIRVNTKAERDALAPGTKYISPSGSISTR